MPLPVPDRTLLATPPLVVTLVQVRFDARETVASVETGTALLERARVLGLAEMTQIFNQIVIIPAPEHAPARQPAGWRFVAKDGSNLTVLADQMTFETPSYRGWDAFSATWAACLDTLAEVVAPALTTRLGLRYVNRITPAGITSAADLRTGELIDPAFLGPSVESALSEYVTGAEGKVALTFPDQIDALVQHGVVREGDTQVFVLDIDCFRTQGSRFDRGEVLAASNELNQCSLQVFQTVVREPLRNEMKKAETS
jgi:uncharacterized protein (TIGR04255 family)